MKLIVPFALLLSSFASVAAEKPKNIIMVVGDGMGPAYTTAYRLYADDKSTPAVEQSVFDRLLVGMARTYPAPVSGYVTDSAASATALSTGVKSYNGAIGVDVNKKPLQTVMEYAKLKGMKTGLAVTSQINHATPASYAAHNESRKNYDEIANSYFDDRVDGKFVADVMLGGGWKYYIREDRNLVEEFKQAGYQYADTYEELAKHKDGKPLLGLFADVGLPWALDMQGKPRLKELTQSAVANLENDKGFFLLVEGSQIDWGGHANDVAAAMAEMKGLAGTLEWLESYVESHPDTLLVVTADHSTGGFSIAANGDYRWDPEWLHMLKASPQTIATRLIDSQDRAGLAAELLGFDVTKEDIASLTTPSDVKSMYKAITAIIDARSNTGWTTSGHTGVDVQIFAKGAGSEHFAGQLNNIEIAQNIFKLMGKK